MKLRDRMEHRVALIIFIMLFIVLGFLTGRTEYLSGFDKAAMDYIHQGENTLTLSIARALGVLGSAAGYTAIGVYILFKAPDRKDYSEFKLYAISALLNTGLNQISKLFYERARPMEYFRVEIAGYSFPSGHSMAAMGIGLTLAYIASKRSGKAKRRYYTASIVVALLMGWSRLYLGVHWLTDIAAGYLGGAIVFLLAINMEFKKK